MTMLMTLRQLNDSLGRTQTSLVLLHGFLDIFQTSAHDQRLRSRLEVAALERLGEVLLPNGY